MAYISATDLQAYISATQMVQFLDDDGDGVADGGLLDNIIATCSSVADAALAPIYTVPFVVVPAAVKSATVFYVCEALYDRRLTPTEINPFRSRAEEWRNVLKLIGSGKLDLDAAASRSISPVFLEAMCMKVNMTLT